MAEAYGALLYEKYELKKKKFQKDQVRKELQVLSNTLEEAFSNPPQYKEYDEYMKRAMNLKPIQQHKLKEINELKREKDLELKRDQAIAMDNLQKEWNRINHNQYIQDEILFMFRRGSVIPD